ncbi:hypothetical protein D3C87_1931360 [compost metagenome]
MVTETDRSRFVSVGDFESVRVSVDLPAPEGEDMIMIRPRRAGRAESAIDPYSTF